MFSSRSKQPSSSTTKPKSRLPIPILLPTPLQPSTTTHPSHSRLPSHPTKSHPHPTNPYIGPLPLSLHVNILSFLPLGDVVSVSRTCKGLGRAVRGEERVWRGRCAVLGVRDPDSVGGLKNGGVGERGSSKTGGQRLGGGLGHGNTRTSISSLKGLNITSPTSPPTFPSGKAVLGVETDGEEDEIDAFSFGEKDSGIGMPEGDGAGEGVGEDDFGDFGEFSTSGVGGRTGFTPNPNAENRNGGFVNAHTNPSGRIAGPSSGNASAGGNGNNLMDFDAFDDFDFSSVPLPSTHNTPGKSKGGGNAGGVGTGAKSGFFALPASPVTNGFGEGRGLGEAGGGSGSGLGRSPNMGGGAGGRRTSFTHFPTTNGIGLGTGIQPVKASSSGVGGSGVGTGTGTGRTKWYDAYKEKHLGLMPYVRILRQASSSPLSTEPDGEGLGHTHHHLTPTQTLSLLFPTSHSPTSSVPPLPLSQQAQTLSDLVLFLTAAIEPVGDWAWIRRVLVGGGGVVDRWEGGCLVQFENYGRRLELGSSGAGGVGLAGKGGMQDKLWVEMRTVAYSSWKVHQSVLRSLDYLNTPSRRNKSSTSSSAMSGAKKLGISFGTGLGGSSGGGGGGEGEVGEWELGRVWVEKREVFYEGGTTGKWDSGENIVKLPNITKGMPATHTLDFTPMSAVFMEYMLNKLREDCAEALRIFGVLADAGGKGDGVREEAGSGISVVRRFVDRLVGEVIGEYVTSLLSSTRLLSQDLFLTAAAATFVQAWRVVDVTKDVVRQAYKQEKGLVGDEQEFDEAGKALLASVGRDAELAVFAAFEQHIDEYLEEEIEWIKNLLNKLCTAWDVKMGNATVSQSQTATFLSSSNPDQVKRNVLAGFRDVLLLPVTIVPLTVTFGVNAIVTGGTQAVNGLAMLNPQRWTGQSGSDGNATVAGAPAVVADAEKTKEIDEKAAAAAAELETETELEKAKKELEDGEKMQLLLSLDTVLELIHADRESLKRIETFQAFPGKYGTRVREAIEEVFILLLKAVAGRHIVPACNQAVQQMQTYKPADAAEGTSNPPLLQYLELVNVVDTVTSILQVYFDKDLARYIDRTDFLNSAMQEKKRFEGALDDAVASGMNAGVEVLMNQVEHIIQTRTQPGEYCPPPGSQLDLGPTRACLDAIQCLEVHCRLLKGSTSKEVLEVFYQEVGLRLQSILQKHIKRQIISLDGGFQMIADLNAYYAFVQTLKQPRLAEEFSNLKMLGQVYIVADAKDLAQIIRDVTRYGGGYRPEDLYEFIQRRSDWKKIEKTVDKAMYALSVKEDCVIM